MLLGIKLAVRSVFKSEPSDVTSSITEDIITPPFQGTNRAIRELPVKSHPPDRKWVRLPNRLSGTRAF